MNSTTSQHSSFLLWFRIIRPQTLFASLCPVAVALMVASIHNTVIHGCTAAITIVCALALQILSNLINDYYDFRKGTDKKGRVGFKRALAEGQVTEKQMRTACFITLGIAVLSGAYLVYIGGLPILVIGLLAILFAWLYTATSHSLSYLGIADIFVFLFYGIIAGWGTAYLQGYNGEDVVYATAVNGLISMCVLNINNLRDIDSDKEAGKLTIPVRLGKQAGDIMMSVLILLMPAFAWIAFRSWIPCLVLIPGITLHFFTRKAQGAEYNKCLLGAGIVNVVYTLLVLILILTD